MNTPLQGEAQPPKKRPLFLFLIGAVFIAVGLLDVWRGVIPLTGGPAHAASDDLLVLSLGIIAVIGGLCVLKGHNWARWLLAAWVALHVAVSIRQPYALLGHVVIFGLILAGLFHPAASRYFRSSSLPHV